MTAELKEIKVNDNKFKMCVNGYLQPKERRLIMKNIRDANIKINKKANVIYKFYKGVSTFHIYLQELKIRQTNKGKKYNMNRDKPRQSRSDKGGTHSYTKTRSDKGVKRGSLSTQFIDKIKDIVSPEQLNAIVSVC